MSADEHQRYRFGPVERRGLIGSLRPAQVIAIAASLATGVILMRALSNGSGVFAALVLCLLVAAFCFWPISGRSAEAWLPIIGRHGLRRARGRHIQRSPAPQVGNTPGDGWSPGPGRRASRGCGRPRALGRASPW